MKYDGCVLYGVRNNVINVLSPLRKLMVVQLFSFLALNETKMFNYIAHNSKPLGKIHYVYFDYHNVKQNSNKLINLFKFLSVTV